MSVKIGDKVRMIVDLPNYWKIGEIGEVVGIDTHDFKIRFSCGRQWNIGSCDFEVIASPLVVGQVWEGDGICDKELRRIIKIDAGGVIYYDNISRGIKGTCNVGSSNFIVRFSKLMTAGGIVVTNPVVSPVVNPVVNQTQNPIVNKEPMFGEQFKDLRDDKSLWGVKRNRPDTNQYKAKGDVK